MRASSLAGVLALCLAEAAVAAPASLPKEAELKKMMARFAPVELTADISKLPTSERRALGKILEAARVMDGLFLRQAWGGNEAMLLDLANDVTPLGKLRLSAFLLNKGPWWREEGDRPFIPGAPEKPKGGSFYPAGVSKDELEAWMASVPEADQARVRGFFTNIRKSADGKLRFVWYNIDYQPELEIAAAALREAGALTEQPTLKAFLTSRADAFMSNDYYNSDVAWMQLDASIEPTIGPYETYEDHWFSAKAAFESFITLRDDVETQKLTKFSGELQDLENNLPIDAALLNPKLGAMAPIRVVNAIYTSGDANKSVQTAAFSLPNDERIIKEKGTKKVMLKNVQEAKFKMVLVPISKVLLSSADQKNVSFDAFFTHILMHELMHGLGPHEITRDGVTQSVRAALGEFSSAFEEAKADVSGLWAMQRLIDKGVVDKALEKAMYSTYLASTFRSVRFGLNEAHGKGQAMQLSYFLDAGAYKVAKNGTFAVDVAKMKEAITSLTREIMTIQGAGDKTRAGEMLTRLGVIRPEAKKVMDKLASKVPVDIAPRFVTAEKLEAELGIGASGSK
jgi:hypothetical protein